jgi:hypothetical protein
LLQTLNQGGTTLSLIDAFIDSTEYRLRFGTAGTGGFEGDLATRPTGDGVFRANDLEVARQFFAGQAMNPDFNEFQRADVAPFETRGNGALNAADIQQLRNYIAQLSPAQAAGGPMAAAAIPSLFLADAPGDQHKAGRSLRITSAKSERNRLTIAVELDARGDEVGVSFSLLFDPASLINPVVEMGRQAPGGALLTLNTKQVSEGRLGVLIDSERAFGRSRAGRIVTITFDPVPKTGAYSTRIAFAGWPIGVSVSDRAARSLPVRPIGSQVLLRKNE